MHISALDSHNIAFNSSMALDGEGYGVVIRVGDHTFIGAHVCTFILMYTSVLQAVWPS